MESYEKIYTLPVLPTRGIVLFPGTSINFDVGRDASRIAIDEAGKSETNILIVCQKDINETNAKSNSLYKVGTIARINQIMHMPDNVTRIIATGISRAVVREYLSGEPYISACAAEVDTFYAAPGPMKTAYLDMLKNEFKNFFSENPRLNADNFVNVIGMTNLDKLCDTVASGLDVDYDVKQNLLEEFNPYRRCEKILAAIKNRMQILELERKIGYKVKENIDKNQREYYLREQMKVISEELDEDSSPKKDADEFTERLNKCKITGDSKEKIMKEISRFSHMPAQSSESNVLRNYLDTVLSLPWIKKSKETFDISQAKNILNEDHYGLEKVKERILEYLAVRHFTNGKVGTILCFVGPPGVGKTSVAKSVARALNRKYVRISLGGIHDESDIRGHRKTYIGAMEGRIIAAMSEAKVKNPLLLLDEIDKMGSDYKGDPSAALLEVLDYEQNSAFRDHYIEIPFDLSQVLFITTANTLDTISGPLLDRMEIIELSGYTSSEKLNIAKRYLVKKSLEKNGLTDEQVKFDDSALKDIIEYYTREAGVRKLEQQINSLCRKAAKAILEQQKDSVRITSRNLKSYLGRHRYHFDMMNSEPQVGIARGLAWTSVGGETLSIEVNVMKGTGKIELTGKLGDVMKESAMTAISYIRSISDRFAIDEDFYKKKDIHIHIPEGAVPKDGPSAGITMATAVISALSGKAVRNDIAMTGEITLRGRVLPIGGLKEKSIAAYRAGIRTVFIPHENKADIDDIPKEIAKQIEFIPVKEAKEVFDIAIL
ncbi:MAG: endopeptidase La [bacterium]|nr:endopeptidase La [bacterium]